MKAWLRNQLWQPAFEADPVPVDGARRLVPWLSVVALYLYVGVNRGELLTPAMAVALVLAPAYVFAAGVCFDRLRGDPAAQLRLWAVEGFAGVTVILYVAVADPNVISPVTLVIVGSLSTASMMFKPAYVMALGAYGAAGTVVSSLLVYGVADARPGYLIFVAAAILLVSAYAALRASADETLRRRLADARDQLAASHSRLERQFNAYLDSVPVVHFTLTPEGIMTVIASSLLLEAMPGIAALNARHYGEIGGLDPAYVLAIDRLVEQGEPFEMETQWGDRTFQVMAAPYVEDGVRSGSFGLAVDVTGQRDLERRLSRAQRLESLGRMAGGVAHDFNNILTVISGYGDLALMKIDETHEVHADISEMQAAARRAQGLTRQLLAFSRTQPTYPRPADLNAIVVDMGGILCPLVGEDVALESSLTPNMPAVMVDPAQVEQVIINLVVNARDATGPGGTIAIATAICDESGDREVVLTVSDDGAGMTPEVVDRIFEPFFTTKDEHRGTGLGLATVYGIVTQAQGSITVDSTPGAGTTFTICLPAIVQPALAEPPLTPDRLGVPVAGGVALVCEDDPILRQLICRELQLAGFRVEAAANGSEAIELLECCDGAVDIVVTDIVMPRMGGIELVEIVAARWPWIAALMLSGYPGNADGAAQVSRSDAGFLGKPFSRIDLLAAVQGAIESRREHRARAIAPAELRPTAV